MFKLNNGTAKYYCDVSFTTSEFYTKNNMPIYMSLYGYPNDIKQLSRKIAKKPYIFSQKYTFYPNLHNIKTEYKSGVGHLIVYLKQQRFISSDRIISRTLDRFSFIARRIPMI